MSTIVYASIDVETDGPCPLVNNMLSLGIYFVDKNENQIFEYYANYELLDNHIENQETMDFWNKNKNMYNFTRQNQQNVVQAMYELSCILVNMSLDYNIKFVAQPACFDWMFFKSYYEYAKQIDRRIKFDIGFKCICMTSEFDLYCKINRINKQEMMNRFYRQNSSLLHDALYDAKVQGIRYVKFIKLASQNHQTCDKT